MISGDSRDLPLAVADDIVAVMRTVPVQ